MNKKQKLKAEGPPLTVAVAHTPLGLDAASTLQSTEADIVEVRLDCLMQHLERVRKVLRKVKLPILLTARHPTEGGAFELSPANRCSLLEEFLPQAAAVDIEMRSVNAMESVLREAEKRGVLKVFSFHDFQSTPSIEKLQQLAIKAREAGANIVKIATKLHCPADIIPLLQLQALSANFPTATMGMGPLGNISRLTLAAAGSRLNYGFLDCPQVEGQWPATRLRELLEEIIP